jgi:mono/diheme cytochrome c family protein
MIIVLSHIKIQAQTGVDIYLNYCSGCHGPKLEGGRAPSLLQSKWKYGNDKKSIEKTISFGIPGTQMMGWKEILSNEQIEELSIYLTSLQKNSRQKDGKKKQNK